MIKKVILENFLSFQRDEADFEDSKFIIIIGPNWSGKTSIFQAIKFALGSNERDERYKKWADFIRNGQDHAMVELHILHNKELIKIRRLVIKGQSPFFEITKEHNGNFKRVHANEIQKLISDLGINPDNQFAFVSQGKIDAIKNLKPAELCSFLEDGIGLKGLRDELLQEKRNILRLHKDFQSLVSRRNTLNISLNLLQPKLERLQEKHKLLRSKRVYEDELLYANKNKLEEKIALLKQNIKTIQLNITEIKRDAEKYEQNITEKELKINDIDLNINNFSKESGKLNYKKKNLIDKIKKWENEKVQAKTELDLLNQKVLRTEKTLRNVENQKNSLENETDLIGTEIKTLKSKIDALIKEQNLLAKKIKQNEEFLNDYNQLVHKKQNCLKNIEENRIKTKDINSEINEIFQSFKDIEHKLDKNKWFLDNPTTDLLMHIDIELRKTSKDLFSLSKELDRIQLERTNIITKYKQLQISLRERKVLLPASINILKEEIEKRELAKKVKGPIIDFLKYNDKLSYAIESVLGERLLYSFIVSDWDTLSLMNRLKNKYNAYCNIYITKDLSILPLVEFSADRIIGYLAELIEVVNNDNDVKKVIYSKVKNCLVVEDYHAGIQIYKNYNFKGKCVTLKGEQIISYKYVYETPYQKRLKGFLSSGTLKEQLNNLESEIDSLNERISDLKVEQSKIDLDEKELYKKKGAFNDLLYNFNQKQRLTTKKNKLYELLHNLEKNTAMTQNNINIIEKQIKNLESQRDPEIFRCSERFKEIPDELNIFNEDLKKWDLKLNDNVEQRQAVIERLNNYKDNLRILKEDYDMKKQLFEKSDKDAFEIYRKLELIDDQIDGIEENISKFKKKKLNIQEEITSLNKEHVEIKINLEQQNIKNTELEQDLISNESDLERINFEIGSVISSKHFEMRSLDEIKGDILRIDKELLKYYDIDDSILVEKEEILSSMKKISKNQTNLEKDIKIAIKTEKKMEDTYYNKFKSTLNDLELRINKRFESANIKSYCALNLIGNFEDLGIDIKAATTKDQLKSCKALSGGQISMISICLILSLQEIKPSPLCMFDEAGMFLDEKNSEASYHMIKTTLEQNPIQLLMFLPNSSNNLFKLADKLIGVARTGKKEISTILKPKVLK